MGVRHIGWLGIVRLSPEGWPIPLLVFAYALFLSDLAWARPPLRTVRDVRHWSNPTYTRVVIDVDGEVQYRAGRLRNPDRLYFDLLNSRMTPNVKGLPLRVHDNILSEIRAAQNQPDVVRVVLDLKALREYHIFTIADPYRIVIDIKGSDEQRRSPPPEAASRPSQPRAGSPSSPPGLALAREQRWHAVIDPGHGGKDPGAIGAAGLMEKDVVLDIAKRLKSLMQQELPWKVTLTRESDVFVPLEERTAIANATRANLFISIHANAAERPDLQGVETYFLDLATDEGAMRTAARENAASLAQMSDLQLILRDLLLTSKRNVSSLLAGSVQQALMQVPPGGKNGRDLGVKHAPFYVLMGAEMPAILVETAFISNPAEERKLGDPKYRAEVAGAIVAGINEYMAAAQGSVARQVSR